MHVSIYSDLSVRQPSLLSPSPAVTALAIFAQNGPQAACRDPKPGEEFDTMKFLEPKWELQSAERGIVTIREWSKIVVKSSLSG